MHKSYLADGLQMLAALGDVGSLEYCVSEARRLVCEVEISAATESCDRCNHCHYRREFVEVDIAEEPRLIE